VGRRAYIGISLAALLAVSGCTGDGGETASPTVASRTAAGTSAPPGPAETTRPPTTEVTPTPSTTTTAPPDPASMQALIDKDYDGRNLKLGREGGSTSAYRQYYATYEGDGLTISGRINIPRGAGPFPAVVLAHGHVPLDEYTNGATMLRERDYLARQGYVTLHIDYRNHAQSDDDPDNGANLRVGYAIDAINAGLALQQFTSVDPDRIGIVGRSMGGGVVYGAVVAKPGLFKAAVAYAPVSSDSIDNFNMWMRRDNDRESAARETMARLGTPERSPETWALTSPRTYFSRVTDPILIHHGTADESCPIEWSEETVAALKKAGKKVTYYVYEGQRHTFTSQWPLSIRRTEAFLNANLGD
jgi:dipeptidyl aminopeptidase/acylaminoacyl peptidase